MPDIKLGRETYILVSDGDAALFPDPNLFPSPDIFPIGGVEQITKIVAGTVHLSEMLSDGNLEFGRMLYSKLEFTVYDTDDISGKYISVYQEDDGVVTQIFTGIVDSAKRDRLGLDREIVAYDLGYTYGQIDVATWWDNYWDALEQQGVYTSTVGAVRESLLQHINCRYETVVLPNDSFRVSKGLDFDTFLFSSVISMLCAVSLSFPHFSRDGVLEFIILDTEEVPTNLDGLLEGENSSFQEYTTMPITGLNFYDLEGALLCSVGTKQNVYSFQNNVFLGGTYRTLLELQTLGEAMLDYLADLSYTPSNVKMIVSDTTLQLGDRVSTQLGSFYILSNELSSSQLIDQTISAAGDERLTSSDTGKTEFAMGAVVKDFQSFKTETYVALQTLDDSIRSDVASSQKEWDTTGYTISAYGYKDPDTYQVNPADYTNEYYLDQKTGYVYLSNGSAWSKVAELQSIQVSLNSTITQTAAAINLRVDGKIGASDVVSAINISTDTIELLTTGRIKIDSGNFTVDASGYAKATDFAAKNTFQILDDNEQYRVYMRAYPPSSQSDYCQVDFTSNTQYSGATAYGPVVTFKSLLAASDSAGGYISAGEITANGTMEVMAGNDPNGYRRSLVLRQPIGNYHIFLASRSDGLAIAKDISYRSNCTNDPTASGTGTTLFIRDIICHQIDADVYGGGGSSERWKNSITTDINEDLDPHRLYDLDVCQFKYNTDYFDDITDKHYNTPLIGFIAEDVDKHYPIACVYDDLELPKDWNLRYIVPPMLKLIQEQKVEIEQLKERVAKLEGGS